MFFVTSLKTGGSEKACVRTANALVPFFDVTVCTLFGGGALQKELSPQVNVKSVFPRFIRGAAHIASYIPPEICHKLFVGGGYDIETAVGDGLESHIVSGSKNKNKYSWIHMDVRFHGNDKSKKTDKRFASFKKIICVSETAKRGFISKFGFGGKLAVAYTPVDADEIISKSNEKSDASCPFDGDFYISVGRLEDVKGFDRLIEAVAANDGVRLVIVGDGTRRKALAERIERAGAGERIFLAGNSENPYPLMKRAKAYICSSLNESFGFAPVEAMALGIPVISTRCGGVEEILNSDNSGILCDNSVDGLRKAIADFESGKLKTDKAAAETRARDFSPEKCLKKFIETVE